jgi:hypothetical protein
MWLDRAYFGHDYIFCSSAEAMHGVDGESAQTQPVRQLMGRYF